MAVGGPDGSVCLVTRFFCDQGLFDGSFVGESCRVDGFGADFDDAVFASGFSLNRRLGHWREGFRR